ncbi:MAG: hypothetical protein M3Y73_21400 [Actinomycetota bacterium]|nr:hypothetical protein [Actinomycetota bacterium]
MSTTAAVDPIDEHLKHCVTEAMSQDGSVSDQNLAEASAAIGRLVRS